MIQIILRIEINARLFPLLPASYKKDSSLTTFLSQLGVLNFNEMIYIVRHVGMSWGDAIRVGT